MTASGFLTLCGGLVLKLQNNSKVSPEPRWQFNAVMLVLEMLAVCRRNTVYYSGIDLLNASTGIASVLSVGQSITTDTSS